ncbi:MAG: hypothetical protein GX180_07690 [Enterococcus sp.]|nr:hypothetical protein [Enterococcus sp.]
MGSKNFIFFKKKSLSQALQFRYAGNKFTNSNVYFKDGKWNFSTSLQPTPFSPTYPIEIVKGKNAGFEVWLVGNIKKIKAPDFPHKYKVDLKNNRVKLCLYHPNKFEWDKNQPIYETLIPWACEWLYYYEYWLDDNIWRGGGEHP